MAEALGSVLERAVERAVEKAVSVVSPRRAYLRQHFRRMDRDPDYRAGIEAILSASGYRKRSLAADKSPSLASVGQVGSDPRSADAVVLSTLHSDRARSRAMRRDNATAAGLIENTALEVVGTGILPQSTVEDPETRDALESVWSERCDVLFPADGLSFRDHQQMVAAKLLEDGEVWIKPAASGREPVWFETVEADRVTWPLGAQPDNVGGSIRDGVERDQHGRIVAYWISKWHPGDVAIPHSPSPLKPVPLAPKDFDRVAPDVARHLALRGRPGQSHGSPWLTPVLEDLARLDLLIDASLKRVSMAACLAVFIESELQIGGIVEVTAEEYGFELDQDLNPGMVFKLAPGEKVSTLSPNFPVTDLNAFVQALLRRAGNAIGLSYLAVSGDASGYNYSSARTDMIRDRRLYRALRKKLVDGYLRWLWVTVMQDARLRGDRRLAGVSDEQINAVAWTLPAQDWVDPRNEGEATKLKIDQGLTTLRDEAAALGRDWEDLARQRAKEAAFIRELAASGTAGSVDKAKDTALDGAQITALQTIVAQVQAGEIPADSAISLIHVAFPMVSCEAAEAIIRPAEPATPGLKAVA